MFERFENAKRERSGWRVVALVGSVMGHIAVGMGVLVWTFWQIDKIKPKGTLLDLAYPMPPPPALGAPDAPPAPKEHKAKVSKPKETVQPTRQPDAAPTPPDPSDGNSAQTPGDPNGTPGGDPHAPPGIGPPGNDPPTQADPLAVPQKVDVAVLEAKRIQGNRNITLPTAVLAQMRDAHQNKAMAVVRLCLDAAGNPEEIRLMKSTGFAAADEKIRSEMGEWRYRPTTVNGRAVPVCTAIVINYVVE